MALKRWTKEEYARAKEMVSAGRTMEEVGRALGRTERAVIAQFKYVNLSPLEKEKRAEYERNRRHGVHKTLTSLAGIKFEANTATPPPEVIEERNVRTLAPHRDITSMICGDPPLGYSALDRMPVEGPKSLMDYFTVPRSQQ